jgi:zinc protease
MHKRITIATWWLVLLVFALTPGFSQVTKVDELRFPSLGEFNIPQPERMVLDNGMVLMLLEDSELPLIRASVRVRTGARLEPAEKIGLAGLTGTVMRTGGTRSMSGDDLDDYLEGKAAVIETYIGTESGGASMSCLKQDFPEVLRILSDVLRNPVFDEEKIKVAKNEVIAGISRQNDDPQGILFREFNQIVYGESSPYAREATYATVQAITQEEMREWHSRYFHPNRSIIGLVGDFKSAEVVELVKQVFGNWPKGPEVRDVEAGYREEVPAGVYQVEKDDMNQSNIIMGHLGIRVDNPDYNAVQVLNEILSGGFASRLFSNVRTAKGLAYAVDGGVGAGWDRRGTFNLWMTTKTESTGAAVEALLQEARDITAKPPTEEEVQKAKTAILNSFIFRSDSRQKILNQQLTFEYYGYPLDWLARYRDGIEKVSVEEVRRAARNHIHPGSFAILVVGPATGMDKPLTTFGAVTRVDIEIPEPEPPPAPEATSETRERGRELISRAVEAAGGAAAIDAVQTLEEKGTVVARVPEQGEMELKSSMVIAFPDRYVQEVTLPFGTITTVFTPTEAFMKTPGGVRPVPDSALKELRRNLDRNLLAILKNRQSQGFSASAAGKEQMDGHDLELVRVEANGEAMTLGIDPASGRVLRMAYRGTDLSGTPGDLVLTFSDFRAAGNLTLPFVASVTVNGEPSMTINTESMATNVALDPSLFVKPSQ